MIRPFKPLIVTMALALLLIGIGPKSIVSAAETTKKTHIAIELNGETVKLADPALMVENRTYIPVARVAQLLGAKTSWNKVNEELTIHTALGDKIVLGNEVPVVYFNGARYRMGALPFLADDRLYVPLRQLSELLHAELKWNADTDVIELKTVEPAAITDEFGLDQISQQFDISKEELLKRNALSGESKIAAGEKLKVVIPSFFNKAAKPFTEADLMLLAKITMVEAGYESYEGQLALANVILNRVKNAKFPDSIRDVIYSGRQFPPAHNGLLDKSQPNAGALRAAKDALNGKNNVKDAVYFFNPAVSQGPFWSGLEVISTIGHHRFAK
ncbi:cell wall hydrolase [Paenibacillus sp. CF384]|uniref:cell wall hydrolase n=1 Tax=Paenibacillus sp. CF384 TaxID=1884382 RepID=UPI00089888A1|nr:cell wall hydrolase [Paenibacillus sp. CF384]SDX83047.1 Copper amine oxidase N-terminal domain-containing protein [Paenibacillus sp. CF384]